MAIFNSYVNLPDLFGVFRCALKFLSPNIDVNVIHPYRPKTISYDVGVQRPKVTYGLWCVYIYIYCNDINYI